MHDLQKRRRQRIAARRFGWGCVAPLHHRAGRQARTGFHRNIPWGHSRRFDHVQPWHRRGWLRQITDRPENE